METAETTPAAIKESGRQADDDPDGFIPKLGKLKKVVKVNRDLTKQNTQLQNTVESLRRERDVLLSEQEKLKRETISLEKELKIFRQGSLEAEIDTTEFEEKIAWLEAKVAEKEEQRASLHRKLELQVELYGGRPTMESGGALEHRGADDSGAPKSTISVRDAHGPNLALERLLEEQGISSRLRRENGELKLRIASLEVELENAQLQQQEPATDTGKHKRSGTFFRRGEKKNRSATVIARRSNQKEVQITEPERSQSPDCSLSATNSNQEFSPRRRSRTTNSPINSPSHSPSMPRRSTVSAGSSKVDVSALQSCLKLAIEEKKSAEEQKKGLEMELSRAKERIEQLQKSTAQSRKLSNASRETETLKYTLKLALSEKNSFSEHLESLRKEVDSLTAQNKSQEKSISDFVAQRDSRQQELERENEQLRKEIEQLKSSASKQSPERTSRRRSVENTKELPPQGAVREERTTNKVVTKPPSSPSPSTAKPLDHEKTAKKIEQPASKQSPERTSRRRSVENTKELPPQGAVREERTTNKVVTKPPPSPSSSTAKPLDHEKTAKKIEQLKSSASKQSPERTSRRRSVENTKEPSLQVAAREERTTVTKPPSSPSSSTAKPLDHEKTAKTTTSSRSARRDSVDKSKDIGSKKVAAARALFEEKIEGEKAQAEASSPKRIRRKSSSGSTNALFIGGTPKSKTTDDKLAATPTSTPSTPSQTPNKSTHQPLTPQRSSNSSLTSPSTSPPTAPKPLNRSTHAPLSSQRSGNGFSISSAKITSSSSCSTGAVTSPTTTTTTSNSSLAVKPPLSSSGSKVSIISVKTSISPSTSPRLSTRKQIKEIVICSPKLERKPFPGAASTHSKSNSFDASKSSPVEQQNTKPPVTKSLSFSQPVSVYPQTTSPSIITPASSSANPSQQLRSSATSPASTTTPKILTTSTKAATTTVKTERVTIKQLPGKLCIPNPVEVKRASSLQDIPEQVSSSGGSSFSTVSGMVSGPGRSPVQLRANRRTQKPRPKTLCHTETTNLVNLISKMREQEMGARQQPRMVNGGMNGSSTK